MLKWEKVLKFLAFAAFWVAIAPVLHMEEAVGTEPISEVANRRIYPTKRYVGGVLFLLSVGRNSKKIIWR